MLSIRFWKVGCGDAITIQYSDSDGLLRNIFVDSGYKGTYKRSIKRQLLQLQQSGARVDLWVITHTDGDHIGGIEAFIQDSYFKEKESLVDQYWFNWSSYSYQPVGSQITIGQGINLRNYLASTGKLKTEDIVADINPVNFHGLELILISPDQQRLEDSKIEWRNEERWTQIAASASDHGTNIEELLSQPFIHDTTPFNGSSIGFIIRYDTKSILLLADSFPLVVIDSLKRLGYGPHNKLKLDYAKLSHHGSKYNFDPELLQYIDCHDFIILANGITHSLPNKWTLSQIVASPYRDQQTIYFHFNDNTPTLQSIFTENDCQKYNFQCHFSSKDYLEIQLND